MLPMHLMAGLIAGGFVRDRRTADLALLYGVGISVLWGIVIVTSVEQSFSGLVGGTGLAVANFLVGGVVASVFRLLYTAAKRGSHPVPPI